MYICGCALLSKGAKNIVVQLAFSSSRVDTAVHRWFDTDTKNRLASERGKCGNTHDGRVSPQAPCADAALS